MPQNKSAAPDFIPADSSPDFIPAEPPPPAQANPSMLQKFGEGAEEIGGRALQQFASPVLHPIDTVKSTLKTLGTSPYDERNPFNQRVREFFTEPDKAKAWEDVAGDVLGSGAQAAAGAGLAKIAGPIAGNLGERYGGYRSPVIPDPLQAASKVATAIRPQGGIPYALESDLAQELPHIKAHADEMGNPFHSQWEASTAAKSLGENGLRHFNENILGPNAGANVPINPPKAFQGFTGPSADQRFMTLGDINSRIGEINDLLRPAYHAKTEGAAMTAMERQGLEQEGNMLRSKLYDELSQRTGIKPEDVKALRESYGKQFGIADTIDAARRARLGQVGAAAEGTSTPLTKSGLLDKAFTTLRGGQKYLADRNFRKASRAFEPSPIEYPEPQYPQKLQGDQFNNPFLNKARR